MPALLAEHVGTEGMLSADGICKQLAGAEWHKRDAGGPDRGRDSIWFDLKLESPNDAIDAALLSVVEALESYRTQLLQRQDEHAASMRDLLPAGFTVNGLNASPSGWRPTRPPLRFELDRTRIIALLMGQQLYGEKWPALRELYQNALDACRYRRASEELAVKESKSARAARYTGQIDIRFGTDIGRRYIECVDDGIGMADRHIRRLFAYAGQRFSDSHEFHIDRARWDEADIPFFPNSRFGVGVLSYFMLAEELDVTSRRWTSPTTTPSAPIHARIVGSGSLFRLESTLDPTRMISDFGTSVRLYLREDSPEDDALLESILTWLGIPEVPVTIRSRGKELTLQSGEVTESFKRRCGAVLLPLAGSESTTHSPRVYIAPSENENDAPYPSDDRGRGIAFADGIEAKLEGSPWPPSLVVNLTEDLGATLTVDRRRIEPASSAIRTVMAWVRESGARAILNWEAPEFFTLHRTLAELHPDVAVQTDAFLRLQQPSMMKATLAGNVGEWPRGGAGLSDLDPEIAFDLLGLRLSEADSFILNEINESRWNSLLLRGARSWSLTPLIEQALIQRVEELAAGGLQLPSWMAHARRFTTRDVSHQFPLRCRGIVNEIQVSGQVGLREVLRWRESEFTPWIEALASMAQIRPEIIAFDLDHADGLPTATKELCMLSSGNELTWLELGYFSKLHGLPIGEVTSLAFELSKHGLSVPNLDETPPEVELADTEMRILTRYFSFTREQARIKGLMESFGPYYSMDLEMIQVHRKFRALYNLPRLPVPVGLTEDQMLLVSRDIDGAPPYVSFVTVGHLFVAFRSSKFQSLSRVLRVARSLPPSLIDSEALPRTSDSVKQIDRLRLNEPAAKIIARLFHGGDRSRPASIWDLSLAATAGDLRPEQFSPILDFLDCFGCETRLCRAFVNSCKGLQPSK
jgi:hypothetical protein